MLICGCHQQCARNDSPANTFKVNSSWEHLSCCWCAFELSIVVTLASVTLRLLHLHQVWAEEKCKTRTQTSRPNGSSSCHLRNTYRSCCLGRKITPFRLVCWQISPLLAPTFGWFLKSCSPKLNVMMKEIANQNTTATLFANHRNRCRSVALQLNIVANKMPKSGIQHLLSVEIKLWPTSESWHLLEKNQQNQSNLVWSWLDSVWLVCESDEIWQNCVMVDLANEHLGQEKSSLSEWKFCTNSY